MRTSIFRSALRLELHFKNKKRYALIGLLSGFSLMAVSPQELDNFEPVIKTFTAGAVVEGMKACEAMAPTNSLGAITLYYIYSRGDYDVPIDYAKAAHYMNLILGQESHFWNGEYDRWQKKYFPATQTEHEIVLDAWNGAQVVPERIPLQGTHPLQQCYEEQMEEIGGVCARTLWAVSESQHPTMSLRLQKRAAELGSAAAKYFPLVKLRDQNGRLSPEQVKQLQEAVDAGHVPSMLTMAFALTSRDSGVPVDATTARKLLSEAISRCNAYQSVGCEHAQNDLREAQKMLAALPDLGQSTEKLLDELNRSYSDKVKWEAIIDEVAGRNDHPSCEFFRGFRMLPDRPKEAMPMIRHAAESNSREACMFLLQQEDPRTNEYWYYLYLAGRTKVPNPRGGSYFREAFLRLQENRPRMQESEYRNALELLAAVDPMADEMFRTTFGERDRLEKSLVIESSDPALLPVEWTEFNGRKVLCCKVTPTTVMNYVDFTFPEGATTPKTITIQPSVAGLDSGDVYADVLLPRKGKKRINIGSQVLSETPKRMRLFVEPAKENFELRVEFE